MYYSERFIISGSIFEYYKYGRPICTSKLGASPGRKKGENVGSFREDTFRKAKKEVRRLINSNLNEWTDKEENRVMSKFLTLTFKENVTELKWANREFSKFIQRLNWYLDATGNYKVKYLTVVEFQKRGAIHYHTVIFNMPYVPAKQLQEVWKHGFIKINKIDDVTNLGAYVAKYMTKKADKESNKETDKLKGQKLYFMSRGLLQPEVVVDYSRVESIKAYVENAKTYETEFEAPFIGKIKYSQKMKSEEYEYWKKCSLIY